MSCDNEPLLNIIAKRSSCASPHKMSEVECNSNSESSSGSLRLEIPKVESEMQVMKVVWEEKNDCS